MPFRALSKLLLFVLWCFVATMALFLAIEGASSTWVVTKKYLAGFRECREHPSRPIRVYDPELGWQGTPDFYDQDYFGKWRWVKYNSLGIRHADEISTKAPANKIRVVCSGDSMTFGTDVANSATWCSFLEDYNDRLETLDLAEEGYGSDQAYLRYIRDSERLGHQVHIFAFIYTDLMERTRVDTAFDVPKPLLSMEGGELKANNLPIPPRDGWRRCLSSNLPILRELHSVTAFAAIGGTHTAPDPQQGLPLALSILQAIAEKDRARGVVTLFVFLPGFWVDPQARQQLSAAVAAEFAKDNIAFLDLSAAAGSAPEEGGHKEYFDSSGHFTTAGNRWIAGEIYGNLSQIMTANSAQSQLFREGKGLEPPWRTEFFGDTQFTVRTDVRKEPFIDFAEFPQRASLEALSCMPLDRDQKVEFLLESDDGAELYVDGNLLIDNGGVHPSQTREGSLTLEKGMHEVRVRYFNELGGGSLRLNAKFDGGLPDLLSGRRMAAPQEIDGKPRCSK